MQRIQVSTLLMPRVPRATNHEHNCERVHAYNLPGIRRYLATGISTTPSSIAGHAAKLSREACPRNECTNMQPLHVCDTPSQQIPHAQETLLLISSDSHRAQLANVPPRFKGA